MISPNIRILRITNGGIDFSKPSLVSARASSPMNRIPVWVRVLHTRFIPLLASEFKAKTLNETVDLCLFQVHKH